MSESFSTPPGGPGDVPAGPSAGTGGGAGCGTGVGVSDTGPVAVAPVDLRDLDASGVLDRVASARRNADREEAALLAAVVAYVDLHPVIDPDSDAPVAWPTSSPLVDRGVA